MKQSPYICEAALASNNEERLVKEDSARWSFLAGRRQIKEVRWFGKDAGDLKIVDLLLTRQETKDARQNPATTVAIVG
jgi:hypothetical protein